MGAVALVLLTGWQALLTVKLYDLVSAVDTPGGLGTPARVYVEVGQAIDRYVDSHPQTQVVVLCPGRDARWADPRWDECPAAIDLVAGQHRPISYINFAAALPSTPETNEDLLVVVAPGGDSAAAELARYATPLAEATVPVRSGAGEYRFFAVHNHLRDAAAALNESGGAADAVLLNIPGGGDSFARFYTGPLPVLELSGGQGNASALHAELARASDSYRHLFVVYKGRDNGDPGGIIDSWLSERTFKVFDTWLGDVRLAMYATAASAGEGRPGAEQTDFGGQLRLVGSKIAPESRSLAPGEVVQIQLEWEVLRRPEADYSAFLQLLDGGGKVVAQSDSLLRHQNEFSHMWAPGATVATRRGLLVPKPVAPGEYKLIAGLYRADQPGLPRLTSPESDHVVLGEITVR
jgi:hypothetical protein